VPAPGMPATPAPGKSLAETNAELMAYFDTENNVYTASQITRLYKGDISWKCRQCEYSWDEAPKVVSRRRNYCQQCASNLPTKKTARPGKSVTDLYPEILNYFSPEENPGIELSTLTPMSCVDINWICERGHHFTSTLSRRVVSLFKDKTRSKGCQECTKIIKATPPEGKSFADMYPEKAKMWNFQKNFPLTPYDINPQSPKSYYWTCEEGHERNVSAASMVKFGCRECNSTNERYQAKEGKALSDLFPDIAKDWHPTKNGKLDPKKIGPRSKKDIEWLCKNGHEKIQKIHLRVLAGGCDECVSSQSSNSEETFRRLCKASKLFSNVSPVTTRLDEVRWETRDNRRMSIDIAVTYKNEAKPILIEYDGWFYHSNDTFADRVQKDEYKTRRLLDAGYKVIRIREAVVNKETKILDIQHPHLLQLVYQHKYKVDDQNIG
jgi:very-short-patch-repair endonuclease